MFKFIHAADIHLDSPLRGLSRYETAPVDVIRDGCRRAFQNLVDLAIEEKVAFILLAGDLYDGDWKDYSTGIFLSQQLGRLAKHDISVIAVAGNHDAANRITKSLKLPTNMIMLSARKIDSVTFDNLNVIVHGQSFKTQHVDENLAAKYHIAEKGMFNIGLLHTSLDGREGHAVYAPCSVNDLKSKGYQYWALGHVHKQEFISRDPWIVFPGCIQGRHIRETGEKGCVLVTVDDGSVSSVEKCPLDVLRWVECSVDLTDISDTRTMLECARKTIEAERLSADGKPIAMRVIFTGATPLSDQLAAYPAGFDQQIRALGAEISDEALWIERVINKTVGKRDLESIVSEDGPLGKMLSSILDSSDNPDTVDDLDDVIADLMQKLPPEVFSKDSPLDLGNAQTIEQLVREAKQMLIGRLLTVGGEK